MKAQRYSRPHSKFFSHLAKTAVVGPKSAGRCLNDRGEQVGIDEAKTAVHESFLLDEAQRLRVRDGADARQGGPLTQPQSAILQTAAGQFTEHHGVHDDAMLSEALLKSGVSSAEMIDPHRGVSQDHGFDHGPSARRATPPWRGFRRGITAAGARQATFGLALDQRL